MKSIYSVSYAQETDFDEILSVWEASVKATRTFLTEKNILFYRELVRDRILKNLDVYCIRNHRNRILAFSGITAGKIEMLFVLPGQEGKGLGKRLVAHAIRLRKAVRIDVNEQSPVALAFYRRLGFVPYARERQDAQGASFPILHLEFPAGKHISY